MSRPPGRGSQAGERFTRIPQRLVTALERGEISYAAFAVTCFLAMKADYQTGELAITLNALRDALQFRGDERTLSRALHEAADAGLIALTVRRGQRRPMLIRIDGATVISGCDLVNEPPLGGEVTSTVTM